jgi:hypothetical protein
MKFDVFAAPVGLEAGRRLALSAMPDAPVVAERDRRATRKRRPPTPALRRLRVRFQAA